jgi:protocatechuate 4,5-dioxygenase beta chain
VAAVVAVLAATHAPGLTGWFDRAPEADQAVVREGYGELRRRLDAARPDVLLMLSNDHLLNWPIGNTPSYTVGIGEEHQGPADWFDEWLALPRFRVPGHPALARAIVRESARHGIMMAFLRRLELDDGLSVPLHYLTPGMDVPVVPLTMNCTVPPLPSSDDAYRLGQVLREIVVAWPGRERVAAVATGGLSHEPGGPRYLQVDEAFDRWFLDLLAEGDHRRILRECTVERMEAAGSGGTAELLAWIAALPFTAGPAEVLGYTPSVAWRTGTGMVAWPVSPGAAAGTRST